MYNNPQGSYPPSQPDPRQDGSTNNFYPPPSQNPAMPGGENGANSFQPGPSAPTQNFPPQGQWGGGPPPFQQNAYPSQNQPPVQPRFVYGAPSQRSGLMPSRGGKKNNFSIIMISGATALALIIGLALFVSLSNQGQKAPNPGVQADLVTPTPTQDTTTPTPEATSTPMPTPTVAATPTMDTTTTTTTPAAYTPPPAAAQQPVPQPAAPTPKPAVPTAKPVATPTVDPESFNYDYDATNGTLVTNPPADFCTPGHEAQNFNVTCVADFFPGNGYVVTCADNKHVSHNGGNGACGQYKGEGKKWYKHPIKK